MFTRKRIVIALGGNALGNTLPEQMVAVKTTAKDIMRSDRRRSSGCCCTWKRATGWHDQQCHVCSLQRR